MFRFKFIYLFSSRQVKLLASVAAAAACVCALALWARGPARAAPPHCSYHSDLSCHYTVTRDDLMSVDQLTSVEYGFGIDNSRRIFFHETSCSGSLDARQACSVESAARSNPDWQVHVLFSSPVSGRAVLTGGLPMSSLIHYDNIRFWRVHIRDYVAGTPLEKIVVGGKLDKSQHRVTHASDVLRFATLYKHPGVYLDLDMIVVQPLDALRTNFAVSENNLNVSAAVLAFSGDKAGRSLAAEAVHELATTFNGDVFAYNGPGVMTRVMKRRCRTDNIKDMTAFKCKGASVYGPETAYPVPMKEVERFFGQERLEPSPLTHMYHLWGEETSCWPVPAGSALQRLAQLYCPDVYTDHPAEFGG